MHLSKLPPDRDDSVPEPESNEILTELASAEARLKLEVIQKLIEP